MDSNLNPERSEIALVLTGETGQGAETFGTSFAGVAPAKQSPADLHLTGTGSICINMSWQMTLNRTEVISCLSY
jgi:hypothetical protein